jgi:hypothetical protein
MQVLKPSAYGLVSLRGRDGVKIEQGAVWCEYGIISYGMSGELCLGCIQDDYFVIFSSDQNHVRYSSKYRWPMVAL